MVEHQPRLLGSRVRFPAGVFAIFSVSAKSFTSNFPFPFSFLLSPFPSSSFPFPSPSDLSFALKKRVLRFYPNKEKKGHEKRRKPNCAGA